MKKKVAFITLHGMGDTEKNYSDEIFSSLKDRLGTKYDEIHFGSVYYQDILQANENIVWHKVSRKLKWDALRKFLLFGFADAAGLENGKESTSSVYAQAQIIIATELLAAYKATGGAGSVVILAQSLGCHVASCYFWDATLFASGKKVKAGIWQDKVLLEKEINGGISLTDLELGFIQGNSLRFFNTTGCNIPIFVAAHLSKDILPMQPNNQFEWNNFYDKDDVLGWPLADLSAEYGKVVRDHAINAGSGIIDWILKSWNPWSHGQYWGDDQVLDAIEKQLKQLLK